MKLKLFPFFILSIFLFPMLFIPLTVSASETLYIPNVNYDSGNGVFSEDWTYYEIVLQGSDHVLHEKSAAPAATYQYYDYAFPASYEVLLDFRIDATTGAYHIIYMYDVTQGTSKPSLRVTANEHNDTHARLTVNGVSTGVYFTKTYFHSLLVNVTNGNVAKFWLDGIESPSTYTASYTYRTRFTIGSPISTQGDCYYDDVSIVSRVGSIPIAGINVSPQNGDGLTNFIFTDNSSLDNTPFPTNYNWTFGDGNWTNTKHANHTYIHAGTYQVILNVSNRLGYDLAYTNITVTGISIGGGEEVSDDMFGFIALLAMITVLNLYAMKSGTGLLSIFALMGLIISASLLWPDSPITTALLMVTVLGNIAITIKTVT